MTGAPGAPLSATENGVMRGLGFKGLNRGARGMFLELLFASDKLVPRRLQGWLG